jgi:predicted Rossmann fold flavoprotein
MSARRVIVVGGGAAGLFAAGSAAACGAETLLLEKMDRLGRKLRMAGAGRCNLTNTSQLEDFIGHFGRNGRFLRGAFSRLFSSELISFFEGIGLPTVTERGGRVFPASGKAQDVVAALDAWVRENGVKVKLGSAVDRLMVEDGRVTGVKLKDGGTHGGDAVIVVTGGLSYPATGSSGDGYRLAEEAGHTLVPVRPSLVPLETAGDTASNLQGLSLKEVHVRVYVDGKNKDEAFGEMLFTHFGVSGPIILTLSRNIVDALKDGKVVALSIDLKPALDEAKLEARLLRDIASHGKQQFKTLLRGLLPRMLIDTCIELTEIPAEMPAHQITAGERRRLRTWLKDFRLEISGHRPIDEAIVTAGGVSTREVDPRTMASRVVKGLYFAGEVLDIDGDTGGYNLQAAFSTGWVAGESAASEHP